MNNKMKAAVGLIYIAFVGFAIDFFSYFNVYSVTTSYNSYSYSVSSSSKTILQACLDGTIEGGRFCFILTTILLFIALFVDLAMIFKVAKRNPPSRGMFGLTIAYGVACIVLAIVQIAIFSKVGNISSESSSSSATVSTGTDFLFLYIGSFEAAIFSIVGGGMGLKALEEPLDVPNSEEQSVSSDSDSNNGHSQPAIPAKVSEPLEMNVGDIVKYRFLSGTSLYQKKNDTAIRCRIEGSDEFELLEKNEQLMTGKIRRLSDGEIFEDVGLSLFVVESNPSSSSVTEEKPVSSEENKIKLLKEYKQLLDDGVITQEEFENKKKDLL